ncbi:Huntingtin interacting protein 1 [Fasciolopsis buskii]|uniref:Huntingtin interacting protein 1 n=1 Tax=Fasciolopsis buskii TaxID=27845 RepID=A0A8E0VF36_9TREM|nr:Huntingtin interacting protein 1 [Fasciolopsis buski]
MLENKVDRSNKITRLFTDYPILVAGVIFTGFALVNGFRLSRLPAESVGAQRMMRWRIYGQGGTLALGAYAALAGYKYATSD